MDQAANDPRLVLNDDSVICRACYEPPALEIDPGQVPIGETDRLPCCICGAGSPGVES